MFRSLVGRGGVSSFIVMVLAWAILVGVMVELARVASLLLG